MKKILFLLVLLGSCMPSNFYVIEKKIIKKISKNPNSYLTKDCEVSFINLGRVQEMRSTIIIYFDFNRNDSLYSCREVYTYDYEFFSSVIKDRNGKVISTKNIWDVNP